MTRNKEQLTISERVDKKVSFIIALQVTLLGGKNVLVQGFPFMFEINTKLNIINLSIVTICYIYAFKLLFSRNLCKNAILFYSFIIFSILFTFLVFPQNTPYLLEISLRWIVVCLVTGYLVAKLNSFEWLQRYMLLSSYILTVLCIGFSVVISTIGYIASDGESTYSLPMSLVALWAVMWQLHAFFKQSNKIALLAACVTIGIIVMFGSRNPLIAIAFYLLVQIFDNSRGKSKSKKILSQTILCFVAVLAFFWKRVLYFIFSIFESLGLSSRSINYVREAMENDVDITSGRNDIHGNLVDLIFEHPILGMGVGGDVANMEERAHSLYLTIFSNYGIIIGTLFLVFIASQCLIALKKSRSLDHQILVMFMCMVFPRGFTDGDMWESDIFWFMMGVVFMILHKNKAKYVRNKDNKYNILKA